MTDKDFVTEVRARTGEPVEMIWKTVNFVYRETKQKCFYPINYVYENIISIIEADYMCSSLNAAVSMYTTELANG